MPAKVQSDLEAINKAKQRDERTKAQQLFQSSSDSRKRFDWEWLTRDLFRRGYHFSRYNPSNKTVILATKSVTRIPINITHAQMRAIKNQVTSVRPKWEVFPQGLSDESVQNARYAGRLLDYYYDHLNLRRKLKDTVIQGLMYSVGGPWQVGYDPDGGSDGSGEVFIWNLDPYDFYVDQSATCINDAEFVIKAVRTSLATVKANPDYHFSTPVDQLQGEARLAASEYKQFMLQARRYWQGKTNVEEESGVILKEAWIKRRVTEKNKEELKMELISHDEDAEDLRLGEVVMRYIVFLDQLEDPLQFKLLREKDFPFSFFQADTNPLEMYGESWIKHVIPMNRVLNALESSVFRFNYKYAIGRIVIDKNAGVRIFTNEHGDIVEKNAGSEVSFPGMPPLPQSYQQQIANMRTYIEDVGGAHEVTMGRIPMGVKSGIGIAELKAADAVNQQDIVDGLEDFLTDVGYKLLKMIAKNYDVPHVVRALGKSGKPDFFTVVGEVGAKNRKKRSVKIGMDTFDLGVIAEDNEVKVTVGSWLAYTKSERLAQLKEYYSAGIIDQQTFLEHAEFADVQDIIDRTRDDALVKKYAGTPAAGAPANAGVSDLDIAKQENFMMVTEGRIDVPVFEADNHFIHIAEHKNALGTEKQPEVEKHIQKHIDYIKQGAQAPARPEAQLPAIAEQPAIAPTANQPTMAPTGLAPQTPMPQQPGSPEEAALMQSLMQVAGGGQ